MLFVLKKQQTSINLIMRTRLGGAIKSKNMLSECWGRGIQIGIHPIFQRGAYAYSNLHTNLDTIIKK